MFSWFLGQKVDLLNFSEYLHEVTTAKLGEIISTIFLVWDLWDEKVPKWVHNEFFKFYGELKYKLCLILHEVTVS